MNYFNTKQNMESSILFLQQEHASILKGLHEEIAVLQKKYTDLTFQLTMNGLMIDEPGSTDNQMLEVQHELDTSWAKITTLEKNLTERDKHIEHLEAEARIQRKRWFDENRSQSQDMNTLRAQLEAKANHVAYLTTELHRLKQKHRLEHSTTANKNAENNTAMVSQIPPSDPSYLNNASMVSQIPPSDPSYLNPDWTQSVKKSHHQLTPAPPKREKTLGPGSAASRIRRSGHGGRSVLSTGITGKTMTAVHPSSAEAAGIGRHTHPLRLSPARSNGSQSPDISSFLPQPKEMAVPAVAAKHAPILPPISYQVSGSAMNPVLVHQVVSSTSQHRPKNVSSDAAIVTLAVENAAPETGWPLAHESRSSEYN